MTASEIARETIKQMAVRRVEPTPDNYAQIYLEISGKPAKEDAASALRKALKQLPHDSMEQTNWVNRWEKVLKQDNWQGLADLLKEAMLQQLSHSTKWPKAIRTLMQGWDHKRTGMDLGKKREMLERVLINFGNDDTLSEKLLGMANNWLPADARVEGVTAAPESKDNVAVTAAPAAIEPLNKEELPGENFLHDYIF